MISDKEFQVIDPKKKDIEWANNIIREFRNRVTPFVATSEYALRLRNLLEGISIHEIKAMFRDEAAIGFEIMPLLVLERIRNQIVSELKKGGIYVQLNSIDPSSVDDKNRDMQLLKNRSLIEGDLTNLSRQIGGNDFSMEKRSEEDGEELFSGNVAAFDRMGLNSNNPYHVQYFFDTHYKLNYEIAGEQIVDLCFKVNEVDKMIDRWVIDIMSSKRIAMRHYINEVSGQITYRYISPDSIKLIPGKRTDGRDAECITVEENVSVAEAIRRLGNNFDWDRDYMQMVYAVNAQCGSNYNGIIRRGIIYADPKLPKINPDAPTEILAYGKDVNFCTYDNFLDFKVGIGYIEWRSIDAKSYKSGSNYYGNFRMIPVPNNTTLHPNSSYQKESYYNEVIYKSNYLILGVGEHRLYDFGRLYHQDIEGLYDEYSNYSIILRTELGRTIEEITRPFCATASECFTKMRVMIRKAKPKGRSYNFESLVKTASMMFGGTDAKVSVTELMKVFEEGINEIYTMPEIDGKPVGGGTNPNFDKPNGLDPTTMTFSQLIDWCVYKSWEFIGINPPAENISPDEKKSGGIKPQLISIMNSRNSTDYIPNMMLDLLSDSVRYTCNVSQDFLQDSTCLPFKWIANALDINIAKGFARFNKYSASRMGIFVDCFSNINEREEVKLATADAVAKGEIGYDVKLMIDAINNPKKAAQILAFEKERAKAEAEQAEMIRQQRALELVSANHNSKMEEIRLKGDYDLKQEEIRAKGYYEAHVGAAQLRLQGQRERILTEGDKYEAQARANIAEETAKANLENQKPMEFGGQ